MNNTFGELVMMLFHSRTNAHLLHLQTNSYAMHKALEGYYDGVIDLVDSLVETYQGIYGIYTEYPAAFRLEADPIAMLTTIRKWVASNRQKVSLESNIQNSIDEIQSLIDSTLYKLRELS